DNCSCLMPGTFCDFATGQSEKQQAKHEIETGEPDKSEDCVSVANYFAVAVAGVKQSVDQPRLASQFGSHPTERVGDVGIRKRQHQNPKQQATGFEFSSPILQRGESHEHDEQRPKGDHEME